MQISRFSLKLTLVLFIVLMFVSLPLGFDQHHSGLILSSLNEFDTALSLKGGYPFNQYGPAWILIFHFPLTQAPFATYYLYVKALGMALILICFAITYLLARNYLTRMWSLLPILLMCITYPFFTGFLPWPSLVVMPIVPYVAHTVIRIQDPSGVTRRRGVLMVSCAGILTGVALLSRVQIGLLLFAFTIVLLIVAKTQFRKQYLLSYMAGQFVFLFAIFNFLFEYDWLRSALFDQFVMGFKYLTGDKSTFPVPTRTILIVLMMVVIYVLVQSNRVENLLKSNICLQRMSRILLPSTLIVAILAISPIDRLFYRIWISFLLAVLIISVFEVFRDICASMRIFQTPRAILIVYSAVAFTQVWPLFDQMHAWWGISPLAVLSVLYLRQIRSRLYLPTKRVQSLTLIVAVIILLSVSASKVLDSFAKSTELETPGLRGNFVDPEVASEINAIDDFFRSYIPQGSKVLNLCPDGNVFFTRHRQISAARNIVFWSTMKDNLDLTQHLISASPSFVVICNFTPFTSQLYNFFDFQNEIASKTIPGGRLLGEVLLRESRKIQIYAP